MRSASAPATTIVEITDMLARYANRMDSRLLDECAELFVEDAVLVLNGTRFEGRAAVRGWMEQLSRRPPGVHLTTNAVVDAHGPDRATSVADVAFVVRGADGGFEIQALGRYADTLVRVNGLWYFAERDIEIAAAPASAPR